MNVDTLEEIFNNMSLNMNIIHENITNIKTHYDPDRFIINNDKLQLILETSSNINLLKDQIEDINVIVANDCTLNLTCQQNKEIREYKINKKIEKLFLPYMLYMRICLENR